MNILTVRNYLTSGKTIYDLCLRVTFYARVSTDSEEQLNSLENQVIYFEKFIKEQSNWTFVDGYVDEGISGTSVKKRENFLKMIDNAKKGMFDLILTKEISRFSRNTVDSIRYTQELLGYGVGIIFLNDNINTFDSDSELRLTIMSSIAQEEIRKLSERVRFGYKRSIEKGIVPGNDNFYGYKKNKGKLEIVEDEAELIRLIFNEYSKAKMGTSRLGHYLYNEYNIVSKTGKPLAGTVITRIIRNPKYKGYYCAHKETTADYHSTKRIRFKPEDWIVYKDNDSCPPIVTEELWDKCNKILDINAKNYKNKTPTNMRYALSGKIKCMHDGATFIRGSYKNRRTGEVNKYWGCSNYRKYGRTKTNGCKTPALRYEELLIVFKKILKGIIDNENSILTEIYNLITECKSKDNFTKEIKEIDVKRNLIINAKSELIHMKAMKEINSEEYKLLKDNYDKELKNLEKKKQQYLLKQDTGDYSKDIESFKEKVNKVIFEDEESVFGIIGSIIDKIYVERIEEVDDKQKLMLHINFNILSSYEDGCLNLNDFSLLFSDGEGCYSSNGRTYCGD